MLYFSDNLSILYQDLTQRYDASIIRGGFHKIRSVLELNKEQIKLQTTIVEITIEEHLSRTISVEVPSDLGNEIDREIYAEEKVRDMYKNQEIVLDADDFNGTVLYQVHDVETDNTSEWSNLF